MCAFWDDETGAVNVDWTVMTAALVGMSMATVAAIRVGTEGFGENTGTALRNSALARVFLPPANLDFNFDSVDGLTKTSWGWRAIGSFDGWTAVGDIQVIEVVESGHRGVHSPDGGNWVDLDASPGNLTLTRNLNNLVAGREYKLTFNAADSSLNNGVDIYLGGQFVEHVSPGTIQFQNYEIAFTAGEGAGANLLEFRGTGTADGIGVSLHGIRID